jgi:phage shock protein E
MNPLLRFLPDVFAVALCAGLPGAALAQQPDATDVAQANNPLADVKAFNTQNCYIGKLTETDTYANQFWLRYAGRRSTTSSSSRSGRWRARAPAGPSGRSSSASTCSSSESLPVQVCDARARRGESKVNKFAELIEKLFDKYFLGSGTRSIRPEKEVAKLINGGAFILDVRTAFEAKDGLAPGATNISLPQLNRHLGELPRDRTIVTCCKTGGRAGKARDILERNGFKVINGGGCETVRKIAMRQERS